MIRKKEFWERVYNVTKEENIKIIRKGLAGPADILEAQLQPILWYCLRENDIVSVVEISYDSHQIRKKIDMIFEYNGEYYIVEIKRNGLDLDKLGKNYTDSIDRFQKDFDKLNTAQVLLKNKYKIVNKVFIEIQYFEKNSKKYFPHIRKFKDLISKQSLDWANGDFFEFGGPNDVIFSEDRNNICLSMRILISK